MRNDSSTAQHPNEQRREHGAGTANGPDRVERLACALGGSWLLFHGLRWSSICGTLMAFAGVALTHRAINDAPRAERSGRRRRERGYDPVDEASRESFPASDPPAWTRSHAR